VRLLTMGTEVAGWLDMRAASCVLLALALTACSVGPERAPDVSASSQTASQPQTASIQPASAVVDCSAQIDTAALLPDDYSTVLGSVALPTADGASRALQVGHHSAEPAPNYFAKTGLLVQSRTRFSIEVNHPPSTAALIGWGSSERHPVAGISSTGCQGESWIVFAGGILVREPMCVELTVKVDDSQEVVNVGAGAPCDGQQPPP
jgi:hypothetical protein